jgi:hypothetical protein
MRKAAPAIFRLDHAVSSRDPISYDDDQPCLFTS